jgi:MFS family permease
MVPPDHAPATADRRAVRPTLTLWLLSIAHAVNHAQAVVLPLIFVKIIEEFGVGVQTITFVAAAGAISSGAVQVTFAFITRRIARRWLMGAGGLIFGLGFAAQALATTFTSFAAINIVSRIGGSPQHPVGNGMLAEQFPPERRGFAISAHISGGNVGTVIVAVAGPLILASVGWRGASIIFGIPAALAAVAIMAWVRETGADRLAAISQGSVGAAMGVIVRDPTIRRVYLTAFLGGGGRGLGVANLFALLYLTKVLGLPAETTDVMYGALIVLSVPMPLIAGWLSDRYGRRPIIVGVYLGGRSGSWCSSPSGRASLACGSGWRSWACSRSPRARSCRPSSPTWPRWASATRRSRCTSPSPSASARSGRRPTGRSSRRSARQPGCRSCSC